MWVSSKWLIYYYFRLVYFFKLFSICCDWLSCYYYCSSRHTIFDAVSIKYLCRKTNDPLWCTWLTPFVLLCDTKACMQNAHMQARFKLFCTSDSVHISRCLRGWFTTIRIVFKVPFKTITGKYILSRVAFFLLQGYTLFCLFCTKWNPDMTQEDK